MHEERLEIRAKQGILVPGLSIKVVGKDGEVLGWQRNG